MVICLDDGVETDVEVDMENLWNELDSLTTKFKIRNWSMKECEKKYAFEVSDVPVEADWVEMNYGFNSTSCLRHFPP